VGLTRCGRCADVGGIGGVVCVVWAWCYLEVGRWEEWDGAKPGRECGGASFRFACNILARVFKVLILYCMFESHRSP
jgi:hypothetical protein